MHLLPYSDSSQLVFGKIDYKKRYSGFLGKVKNMRISFTTILSQRVNLSQIAHL